VFQLHYLLPQCTVWENVLLPVLPFNKVVGKEEKLWAEHLLRKVGLWDQRNQKPSEISGGESQRTAVVRALINKPKLILADEPTGNLNSKQGEEIMEIFSKLNKEGVTIIQVTHSDKNAAYGSRIVNLLDGSIV